MLVVHKVIALLAEGVRDGAAARAASDLLYTDKKGKVSATLNIISVDLHTGMVALTRNNPAPFFIGHGEQVDCISEENSPIGFSRNTRPMISEIPVEAGLVLVIYTDGLVHAVRGWVGLWMSDFFKSHVGRPGPLSPGHCGCAAGGGSRPG